jgi:hypothetical protein
MCPACIASAAAMVAGAGSTGGILAVCVAKIRNIFKPKGFGLIQKTKERIKWQQAKSEKKRMEMALWQ